MDWLILFLASWLLLLILVDWKRLKVNIWCGVMAVVMQLSVDTNFISHGFYEVQHKGICLLGSSALFVFGPVFVIGVLFAQFHPVKRMLIILNVFVITGVYSVQELLLLKSGSLIYKNWHFIDSLLINIAAITLLSWFSMIILKKKGPYNC